MPRFLSVSLNPTYQRTISVQRLEKGEVNRARETRFDIAGKGVNTTRVLSQLGASVRHLTHLGPERELLLDLCGREELELVWVPCDSHIRTCITILDDESGSTTEIIEPTEPVDVTTVRKIRELFERELKTADWVILSGTKAPGYPTDLFAEFCHMTHKADVPTVVDFRGDELIASLNANLLLVKINLVEFVTTFLPGLAVSERDDSEAIREARDKLCQLSFDGSEYVITRGAREVLFARNGRVESLVPPRINPVNSIGSGDAFCAGVSFKLANGSSLEEAVREGARCGAVNAMLLKPGTLE
ncbi:MAG: bifunctional hydroxymethylpyrimidine kinase/phosphomethylpyrimidine kinase [Spirochaetaceae bacterium]|nr:bifunctional hydroxymethylpyrimidine kinase/phosphomethylpyrimidine kinase [Spirochaetaceae bacterium]